MATDNAEYEATKAKAIELGYSQPFNFNLWSVDPSIENATAELYGFLETVAGFSGNKKIRTKQLKAIILNLYAAWLIDPERYVSFSRNKTDYTTLPIRYNPLRITFTMVALVDALLSAGYIDHQIGYYGRISIFSPSRVARMRATDKLISFLRNTHKVSQDAISRFDKVETIILRERDKKGRNKAIDYNDNPQIRRMRKKVEAYNALLANTELTLLDAPEDGVPNKSGTANIKLDFTDKFVRRIFNNGSWNDGGRFYGGWWQRISSDWRVCISFNGSKEGATEVDYSGLHIVILYALEGIDYWKEDGKDPYQLDAYDDTEKIRNLLKFILLVAINAKDKKSAIAAIKREINFDPEEYGWVDFEVSDLIEAFASRHTPIANHFYSGAGVKLQRIDADIAERIIDHFLKDQIPVLCVHDSFVIDHAHSNRLVSQMEKALVEVMSAATGGTVTSIKPKMKPRHYWDEKDERDRIIEKRLK